LEGSRIEEDYWPLFNVIKQISESALIKEFLEKRLIDKRMKEVVGGKFKKSCMDKREALEIR
jgi:hypothetical protein